MSSPFVDGALLGADPLGRGAVGGAGRFGGGAIGSDGSGEGGLLGTIELLELAALLLPVAGLALLDEQHHAERERGGKSREALNIEEAQKAHRHFSGRMFAMIAATAMDRTIPSRTKITKWACCRKAKFTASADDEAATGG